MLRWCELVIRAAAPLVPYDIRADWLREWRAELAYALARANRSGRRMPLALLLARAVAPSFMPPGCAGIDGGSR